MRAPRSPLPLVPSIINDSKPAPSQLCVFPEEPSYVRISPIRTVNRISSNDRRWSFNNEHRNPYYSTNMQAMGIAILNIGHHFEASLRIQHRDGGILSHRWDYLSRCSHPLVGRRRTADGRREPAEEVPSSKGKVDPEIGYGESRGKGTETTQTGQTG